jgi:hypothetical protein
MRKTDHVKKQRKIKNRSQRKTTAAPVSKKPVNWNAAKDQYGRSMLMVTGALETRHILSNPEIMSRLTAEQKSTLGKKMLSLTKYCEEYRDRLNAIFEMHAFKTAKDNTFKQMFDIIEVCNLYDAWLADWTDTVANKDLRDIINLANESTYAEETVSGTTI